MRRYLYRKYLIFGAALFLVLSLPPLLIEGLRGRIFAICSPLLRGIAHKEGPSKTLQHLEGENHLLRLEIGKLRALLGQEGSIEAIKKELSDKDLDPRRYVETTFLLGLEIKAIPAKVIYRDPASWSSSFWVNVGEVTNQSLGRTVIEKNSPVIVGKGIVGAIDYVGKRQSRVRLITDVGLKPSVRTVRGSHYLAKGILQGAGTPLWRSINLTLRGVGFNYDFPDGEGPARELATGKPIDPSSKEPPIPLLREGDLLVTTGMDGLFPPGLHVAEVTKVFPLREGAYTYDLEAKPVVKNLDTLHTIFIVPKVGFNIDDLPKLGS